MSKKNNKKKDIKKEILEFLNLDIKEEIEEKKESYNEIVNSQQSEITLNKKTTEIDPNSEEGKQEKKMNFAENPFITVEYLWVQTSSAKSSSPEARTVFSSTYQKLEISM